MVNPHATRTLKTIAYCWISFPILYSMCCLTFFSLSFGDYVRMVLTPWFWLVSGLATFVGFSLLQINWYAWYLFVFSCFTILYQTAVALAFHSHSSYKIPLFIITCLFELGLFFVVSREVRVPYFFPRIRWWESDPRYKLSVPVRLVVNDQELQGEIMDISMGGCFIKSGSNYSLGDEISLFFDLFESPVACRGKVVWRAQSRVTHPKGIGIKFSTVDKETLIVLKAATQKLKHLSRVYSQITRERSWQEYLEREEKTKKKRNAS